MSDLLGKPQRTVLVTGGCGYLGSQLVHDLAARPDGRRIRVLDNLQKGSLQALWDLPAAGRVEFLEGDLLDPSALRRALAGVDAVVHLAALVRSPFSFDNPQWLEQVNHWGTAQLIDACLEVGVARLIYAGSAAVYGPGEGFSEEAPCRTLGPYAQSKARAEAALLASRARGLRPVCLRFGSFYGAAPTTRFETLINRLSYLAAIGRALTVFGRGTQKRPAIHVADASDLIHFVLDRPPPEDPAVLNAVTGNLSVLEVVEVIRSARTEAEVRFTEQDVLTHLSLAVDNARLLGSGWSPRHSVGRGVADLIEKFRGLSAGQRPERRTDNEP